MLVLVLVLVLVLWSLILGVPLFGCVLRIVELPFLPDGRTAHGS